MEGESDEGVVDSGSPQKKRAKKGSHPYPPLIRISRDFYCKTCKVEFADGNKAKKCNQCKTTTLSQRCPFCGFARASGGQFYIHKRKCHLLKKPQVMFFEFFYFFWFFFCWWRKSHRYCFTGIE